MSIDASEAGGLAEQIQAAGAVSEVKVHKNVAGSLGLQLGGGARRWRTVAGRLSAAV